MNRVARWTGIVVSGFLGLLLLALAVVYGVTEVRMRKTYSVQLGALALRDDSATIARGRHIATIRGCVDCHGADLAGRVFIDAPPVGRFFASNLTRGRGGVGSRYTDQDWVRSIRHGVRPDGRPLLFMPAQEFHVLSDQDVGALIAYLRSVPPVDNEPVRNAVGPLGRVLYLAGDFPLLPAELVDHSQTRRSAPEPAPTAEYGAYLATGCTGCHGPDYSGGKIPGTPPAFPPASNLTPDPATGLGTWTEQDFFTALRTGRRPDGSPLREEMPWKLTAQMTDEEIRAIWRHLQSLPPRPYGNR